MNQVMNQAMHEFELIDSFFKPLAKGFPGSLDLSDDAALLTAPEGEELVVTKDAICEGVHFTGSEDPALIAKKLLRVNLSDLAAKGAKPLCYFLALMLPKGTKPEWLKRFAEGLGEDQRRFGIHLAGGDTTATLGPAAFTLTAAGSVPKGQMLRRSGAKVGDIIVVSGTLSDGALGLMAYQGKLDSPHSTYLQQRYLLPEPRLELGLKLRGLATASMDISDGLVQDMGHICAASHVQAHIFIAQLPLSPGAREAIEAKPGLIELALAGGDDYELLFTMPAGAPIPPGCTGIGVIKTGHGVKVLRDGHPIELNMQGYKHF